MSQPPQPPQQPGQPWGQNQPPAGGPFNGQPGQPGQQYPGQPGQPGQPGGQIPFQPAGGPTPPSSGGAGGFFKSLGGRILSAVIGIIVVVAIGLGFRYFQTQQDKANLDNQVDTCVTLTGTTSNVDTKEAGCEDAGFHYYVAASVEANATCPSDDYSEITTSRSGRGSKTDVGKICLMPDFKEGKCYASASTGVMEFEDVACTSADFKVAKVLQVADTSQCESPDDAVSYPTPARTFCLVAPE